jgi:hypothetical protein
MGYNMGTVMAVEYDDGSPRVKTDRLTQHIDGVPRRTHDEEVPVALVERPPRRWALDVDLGKQTAHREPAAVLFGDLVSCTGIEMRGLRDVDDIGAEQGP